MGLHSLRDRSASYYQAIYAWRPVRVSFLDAAGVADVLQVDDEDFALDYSPEALQRIHRLTGGQPFLVQLVGDQLVQMFNRRLRENLRPPERILSEADVEALLEYKGLYEQGTVYFRGIREQARTGPTGQHALLRTLAAHPQGLDRDALAAASGQASPALDEALAALFEHDVLQLEAGRYRFQVELMRLWVAEDRIENS